MTSIVHAQARIERLVKKGVPLREIEDQIELYPFNDDMKAALWLFAYCSLSRRKIREETRGIMYDLAMQDALDQTD